MNRQDLKHLLGDVARALPHAGPWSLDTWGLSRSPDGGLMRGGVELDALLGAVIELGQLTTTAMPFTRALMGLARVHAQTRGLY